MATLPAAARTAFLAQAAACQSMGSPFVARLCGLFCTRLDDRLAVGVAVRDWPGSYLADAVPLRLAGTLNGLALTGAAPTLSACFPPAAVAMDDGALWAVLEQVLVEHEEAVLAGLQQAPQTNEVRRAAALYLGLLHVAALTSEPMSLLELGASAGLNLWLDRYVINLDQTTFGPSVRPALSASGAGAASVYLEPEWRGAELPVALREQKLLIADRAGCDLHPLSVAEPAAVTNLLAYLWPDQRDRIERTQAAVALARSEGAERAEPLVAAMDAATWIGAQLAAVPAGARVIYHSIAWQYFPAATQRSITKMIEQAGTQATVTTPLAWIRYEADAEPGSAALSLRCWPAPAGFRAGAEFALGRVDFHGRWIDYRPPDWLS